MKFDIINSVKGGLYKVEFQLKKHAPELLVGAGVIGGVASGVLACRATLKIDEVLAEPKSNVEKINGYVEENGYSEEYTESDHKKDITLTYTKGGLELIKLYGPSVTLGVLSITSILAGFNILNKRNAGLAAAYATIDRSFKTYRERVIDRFGEDLDKEIRFNVKPTEIEETVVDEKGKEKKVKKKAQSVDKPSDYSRFFMQGCKGWTKDPNYNYMFLRNMEDYANVLLRTKKYLFLNDVYDLLGIARTEAGQVVGWIYDEKNPIGNNCIDFGLHNGADEASCRFINGLEPVILLDFNVDGPILQDFWKAGLDKNGSGNIGRDVIDYPNGL